jgi:UDP-2,4-diacetamido-2,4,6-trideoxy-beta-L-altropyranose hydrolase
MPHLNHSDWLGCDWQHDAEQVRSSLAGLQPDWLVVDHYALDQDWEQFLAPHCRKLLVIDDLADRPHWCDVLLDQNMGSQVENYASLVPEHCQVLAGSRYALLRPDFASLRPCSLLRRQKQPTVRQLLITMGGVDQFNATGQVLQALKVCHFLQECNITVVMGPMAPWLNDVQELAKQMPWPTEVVVNVHDMAQRMADSDLAIGAAGSTSWERCCLGLPTLIVVLADNQVPAAMRLVHAGAAHLLTLGSNLQQQIQDALQFFSTQQGKLGGMSLQSSKIVDGEGVSRIISIMDAAVK